MLKLKDIDLTFNPHTPDAMQLFEDFNLEVETGSFVSIIGSNGSGKTSLLNLVSGTISPDHGSIVLNGEELVNMPEYKRAQRLSRSCHGELWFVDRRGKFKSGGSQG